MLPATSFTPMIVHVRFIRSPYATYAPHSNPPKISTPREILNSNSHLDAEGSAPADRRPALFSDRQNRANHSQHPQADRARLWNSRLVWVRHAGGVIDAAQRHQSVTVRRVDMKKRRITKTRVSVVRSRAKRFGNRIK